jgi:hypothetical protein
MIPDKEVSLYQIANCAISSIFYGQWKESVLCSLSPPHAFIFSYAEKLTRWALAPARFLGIQPTAPGLVLQCGSARKGEDSDRYTKQKQSRVDTARVPKEEWNDPLELRRFRYPDLSPCP